MILLTLLLAACGGDGVPTVKDPNNPVDDKGNAIAATEFLTPYCVGEGKRELNETCQRVLMASRRDSLRGKMPEGW